MDLQWNDRRTRQFITNVGLITSNGPHGPNVMSAEWTHHVSYAPSLISICIHHEDATGQNIDETKEFGVNLAAENQNVAASIAGSSHGQDVDKVAVLKELGIEFIDAKQIKAPMVKGAAMHAECRVLQVIELGDHVMYVGEVVEISADENIAPVVYHNGKYWKLGEQIHKPHQDELDKIASLVEKHTKKK